MNDLFANLFSIVPPTIEDGMYLFNSDHDADCFDSSDVELWRRIERLHKNFNNSIFIDNTASRNLINHIINKSSPVVEVACGPVMGLIPSIKKLSPQHLCLATDASSLVIKEWKKYSSEHDNCEAIDFAQFSLMNIPFKDDSVPAYSSYIGVSSTRNGEIGIQQSLSEIYRTLVPNGFFYTIESTWSDIDAILKVFELIQQTPWEIFRNEKHPYNWRNNFEKTGFEIVDEEIFKTRNLTADDNELGEAAVRFGIDIGIETTAYILKKQ